MHVSFGFSDLYSNQGVGRCASKFEQAGQGRKLTLVPSLNAEPAWVDAVEQLVRETISLPRLPVLSDAAAG